MIKNCPDPVDVQDIQFKLQCKLKIFSNKDVSSFPTPHNLTSCASQYGLLFIGSTTKNLQVIQLSCLENYSPKDKEISNYPRRYVPLPSSPKHICVNCDNTILAVVVEKEKCPVVIFYDVLSFVRENISVIKELRLSASPAVHVTEINWNPSLPTIFTACKSDGTLGVYEIKDNSVDINELPPAAEATTFCWSPKGKQIAVGSRSGKITQYKPDLKAVRVINSPPLQGVQYLISLQWISNYQFLGVFQPSDLESRAKLIIIDAPKVGETTFTDYDDICYSGTGRIPQFFMNFQQQWNLVMVASSNSTEVAVLGLNPPETWVQWIMADSARAELPLSSDRQETFPIGMTFDTSSNKPLPWGESTIPPCPNLLVLSHQGLLCVFNVVNLKNMPTLCSPPNTVKDASGLKFFICEVPSDDAKSKPVSAILSSQQPSLLPQIKPVEQNKPLAFPVPQSSASPTVFTSSQNTVSSTPINKANQPQAPAILSSQMFGGQITVTPIKPQTTTPLDKAQMKDKYSSIFAALNAPTTTAAPVPTKPSTPVSEQIKNIAADATIQIKSSTVEPIIKSDIEENLLGKMIKKECVSLDSELKAILHKGRSIDVNIGTDEEKVDMSNWIKSLEDFLKEIIDISLGENAEVHTLKQNLILSWAWYEEALSYYNTIKDEKTSLILKSRPLDTVTEKRSSEIKKLMYYIESQLLQVSKELDEQWDNFQTEIKKTHRMQMPTMETIFQTMVRQSAVLQRQDYIMKDIRVRLKHKVPLHNPMLLITRENQESLEDTLKRLDLGTEDNRQKILENANSQSRHLTKTKTRKLRNLLREHKVAHITAVKPQLPQSPLSKQIIEAKLSPIVTAAAKKITFTSLPAKEQPFTIIHVDPFKQTSTELSDAKTTTSFPSSSKTTSMFSNLPSAFSSFGNKTEKSTTNTAPTLKANLSANTLPRPISTISTTVPVSTQQSTLFKSTPFNFGNTTIGKGSEIAQKGPSSSAVTPEITSKSLFTFGGHSQPNISLDTKSTTNQTPTSTTTFSFISSSNKLTFTSGASNIFGNLTNPNTTSSLTSQLTKPLTSTALDRKPVTTSVPSVDHSKPMPAFGFSAVSNSSNIFSSLSTKSDTTKNIFGTETSSVSTDNASLINNKSKITSVVSVASTTATTNVSVLNLSSTTAPATTTTTANTPSLSSGFSFKSSTVSSSPMMFGSKTSTAASFPDAEEIEAAKTVPSPVVVSSSTRPVTITAASKSETNLQESTKSDIGASDVPSSTSIFSSTADSTKAFGTSTTNQSSVFKSSTPVISQQGSIFGSSSSQGTIFGANTTTTTTVSITTSKTSIFEGSTSIVAKPSTTVFSIFGSSNTNTPAFSFSSGTTNTAPLVTQPLILASSKPSENVFTTSTTTSTSLFGQSTGVETNAPTSASIFGTNIFAPKSTETPTNIFAPNTTETTSNIFGTNATTKSTGIFDANTNTTSIFGTNTTNTTSIFGTNTTNTSNIFGANTAVTSSIFGKSSPTTTPSVFGQNSATTTTAFGLNPTTTTTSIFGSGSVTSTSSMFGGNSATTSSIFATTPNIFGASSPTTTSSIFGANTSNIFGSGSSTSTATTSAPTIFGTNSHVTTPSGFGTNTSTTSRNIFGSNVSSNSNVFKSESSGSLFGSAPTGTTGETSFNFGNLNVGGNTTTTTNSNIFGGSSTAVNPFDRAGEQKSTFGGGSVFGSPSSTTSSIFGSTPSSTTSSIFGSNQPSTFGTNTQQSVFGNSSFTSNSGSTFGASASFGQTNFGNTAFSPQPGPFSGGGTGVGQSGFSSPTAFQKPSGFGGAPVFGGSPPPAFGGSPSFGAAPAFGGAPSFGSPSKVFGANTGTTFGTAAAAAANTGFSNLANQNTIGFGNLAQQAATSTSTQFSGSSSFSNWR